MKNAKELILEFTAFSFSDPKKAAEMSSKRCCSMPMPVKKVKIISASTVGFVCSPYALRI